MARTHQATPSLLSVQVQPTGKQQQFKTPNGRSRFDDRKKCNTTLPVRPENVEPRLFSQHSF